MKQLAKRSLSLLLALAMCLSLWVVLPAPQAEAASYVYNWGTREDVADEADFTRSTAEEWYARALPMKSCPSCLALPIPLP